jgi:hypothetical protein
MVDQNVFFSTHFVKEPEPSEALSDAMIDQCAFFSTHLMKEPRLWFAIAWRLGSL